VDGDELPEEEEDAVRGRRGAGESVKNERVEAFFFLSWKYITLSYWSVRVAYGAIRKIF
jgi:hypothetical protein